MPARPLATCSVLHCRLSRLFLALAAYLVHSLCSSPKAASTEPTARWFSPTAPLLLCPMQNSSPKSLSAPPTLQRTSQKSTRPLLSSASQQRARQSTKLLTRLSRLPVSLRKLVPTCFSTVNFRPMLLSFRRLAQARLRAARLLERQTHWYSRASKLVTSLTSSFSVSLVPKQLVQFCRVSLSRAMTLAADARLKMFTNSLLSLATRQ